jgi:hypothetical protein
VKRVSRTMAAATLAALAATAALAGDQVGVGGSSTKYPAQIESTVGDKSVKMVLTGAALRKRVIVNVYTIGSYVEEGSPVRSAEELAAADCPKQLHLVMERDIDGKEMAEAFAGAIRANYADPAFKDEVASLSATMRALAIKKGDNVWLTHIPKKGLHCNLAGKKDFLIENPDFSKAVWDIYLGKNNLSDSIKRSLVSRL